MKNSESDPQLEVDFDTLIRSAEIRSREDVLLTNEQTSDSDYDPVSQTAEYMRRAIEFLSGDG